jgi:hypothetical protein
MTGSYPQSPASKDRIYLMWIRDNWKDKQPDSLLKMEDGHGMDGQFISLRKMISETMQINEQIQRRTPPNEKEAKEYVSKLLAFLRRGVHVACVAGTLGPLGTNPNGKN